MRILYLYQYFTLPDMAGSTRAYEMARRLVKQGHEVQVISCKKGWMKLDEDFVYPDSVGGVNVKWLNLTYSNQLNYLQRIIVFLKYIIYSAFLGLKYDCDVIYASSSPLTIGLSAVFLKKWKRKKLIFEVRDLWPEAPIQLGVIKNKILIKILTTMERWIYCNSDTVIGLSPGMVKGIQKTCPQVETSLIPNACDMELFENVKVKRPNDQLNLVYFGTIGYANHVDYLVNAVEIIEKKKISNIFIDIVGNGKFYDHVNQLIIQKGLTQISIKPAVKKSSIPELLGKYDLSIICFRNIPILGTCSPNKLFDSLAAGIPFIVNVEGWMSEMAENEKVGFYIDGNDPGAMVELLIQISNQKSQLIEMGQNCKKLALSTYSRDKLAEKFNHVLEDVVS